MMFPYWFHVLAAFIVAVVGLSGSFALLAWLSWQAACFVYDIIVRHREMYEVVVYCYQNGRTPDLIEAIRRYRERTAQISRDETVARLEAENEGLRDKIRRLQQQRENDERRDD